MDKIVAVTFDIADQCCKTYNAMEWHNFIADTREELPEDLTLDELFDEYYGDEFWYEVLDDSKLAYAVAFDLRSEEFVVCASDTEVEFVQSLVEDSGDEEEVFWA